jgi:ribosomal protein S27E
MQKSVNGTKLEPRRAEASISNLPCPICAAGAMTFGTRLQEISVMVCRSCGTTLTVPHGSSVPS